MAPKNKMPDLSNELWHRFKVVNFNGQHHFSVTPALQHTPQEEKTEPANSSPTIANFFTFVYDGNFDGIGSDYCDGKEGIGGGGHLPHFAICSLT